MTKCSKDIIKRARAVGIDPFPIIQDVVTAVGDVQCSEEGVCTDADVVHKWKALIKNIQQVLGKYGIDADMEVGSYHEPYAMDGYAEVRLMLSSDGNIYMGTIMADFVP